MTGSGQNKPVASRTSSATYSDIDYTSIQIRLRSTLYMIRVMIERHIMEGASDAYAQAVREMIQFTVRVPGFLSGEAFRDLQDDHRRYVMSKWRSLEEFEAWWNSADRTRLMLAVQPLLREPEKVHIMVHD
ncbi:MAG: antibiotic biosynthesis monooxygenase [Gammaproteobacteria bacterium]|nr:MAG: antibiotic biosynthesis monooxygenase [Gammaproteobacteria bacterium]